MVDINIVKMQAEHAIELMMEKIDEIYDDVKRKHMSLTNEDIRVLEKSGVGMNHWMEVLKQLDTLKH